MILDDGKKKKKIFGKYKVVKKAYLQGKPLPSAGYVKRMSYLQY